MPNKTRHGWGELDLLEDDIVSKALGRGENWDDHVYEALLPYCSGDVVDAGANVGALTLRLAKVAKRVIAFEPNETMHRCLVSNAARLGLKNVVAVHRGIYSVETFISPDVTSYPASSWTWPAGTKGDTAAGPASWPNDDRRVSAIKSDCQGADLHVLRGLRRFIVRDRPVIVFEYEKELSLMHGDSWDDYQTWIARHDYSMRQIAEGHGDFICVPNR